MEVRPYLVQIKSQDILDHLLINLNLTPGTSLAITSIDRVKETIRYGLSKMVYTAHCLFFPPRIN